MTTDDDLWDIAEHLLHVRHFDLLPAKVVPGLSPVDRRMFEAGKVGRES